ncbi:MAG: DUF3040 domain-containing protein [Candidatus Nanopelagicales bacterium]|jgi:hypothetical protein|nr:DUF3040 domain-containing protein [Candidatus Nanopelagicales bacterium]MDP4667120.1 DUF3040 domain-containing protein [Candidatus Nanopelagicales bacterium]
MALSDHEQALLEQMERALASEDPKFASALRVPMISRTAPKSIGIAVLGVVIGIGILIAAVTLATPALGVLGFLSIVAGFYFAQLGTKSAAAGQIPTATTKPATNGGFMQGLEERWDRRQDNG